MPFLGHFSFGGSSGDRTHDKRLKRPLLYQLSYRPAFICAGTSLTSVFYNIWAIFSSADASVLIFLNGLDIMLVTNISMKDKIHEQAKRFFESMNAMHRMFGSKGQSIFKKVGLSHQQIEVVYFLAEGQPHTIKEIAAALNATSSAATQVVAGLEKIKIVQRQADSKDKRVVRVSLTPIGRKKLLQFKDIHLRTLEHLMQALSNQERELLISIPSKFIKHLSK